MRTIDVPQKEWRRTLDQFSAAHDGWLISLDVLDSTVGVQPQIRELPLRGITAESHGQDATITISAARADGEHFTHVIHTPTRLRVARTNEGADAGLEIESADGPAAILRFKTIVRPDIVDGLPRA